MIDKKDLKIQTRLIINKIFDEDSVFISTLNDGFVSSVLLGEELEKASLSLGFDRYSFHKVMGESEFLWQNEIKEATKAFLAREIMKYIEVAIIESAKNRRK